ncbi:unnamed protein product [Protopolystoma xenopodis]|uniref:Uncharacterized protein n=1 Tax=Protopolystoma xenopodis TaxID=117903 RepID=A0A448XG73_9PLAT|nr:unnamed protein product [Protopolystoma xenopodis]
MEPSAPVRLRVDEQKNYVCNCLSIGFPQTLFRPPNPTTALATNRSPRAHIHHPWAPVIGLPLFFTKANTPTCKCACRLETGLFAGRPVRNPASCRDMLNLRWYSLNWIGLQQCRVVLTRDNSTAGEMATGLSAEWADGQTEGWTDAHNGRPDDGFLISGWPNRLQMSQSWHRDRVWCAPGPGGSVDGPTLDSM